MANGSNMVSFEREYSNPTKARSDQEILRCVDSVISDNRMQIQERMRRFTMIGKHLEQYLEDNGNKMPLLLCTTGSDGREEKKGEETSPLEVLVYGKQPYETNNIDQRNALREQMEGVVFDKFKQHKIGHHNESLIEVKFLDAYGMAYYKSYDQVAWPTRVLDSKPLMTTNNDILDDGKRILYKALQTEFGKRIQKNVHTKYAEYRKITRRGYTTWKKQQLYHFDEANSLLYFSREGERQQSAVKYGPLRTVQLWSAFMLLRASCDSMSEDAFVEVPSSMKEKLCHLEDNKLLSEEHATRIYDLYRYFLWLYYLAEYVYSHEGMEQTPIPDVQRFSENKEELLRLLVL